MTRIYDCSQTPELLEGLRAARGAIARGEVIVMPTDTVYGIAADAFSPEAVQALLDAKGRGRDAPPPVLVSGPDTLDALAAEVPPPAKWLVEAFWPGGLTIILPARSTLTWDLGDTKGTVAVRCPDHPIARELLADTGPLAVSSANTTGQPAALTAREAADMLGDAVPVILDAGPAGEGLDPAVDDEGRAQPASTIIDATMWQRGEGKLRIVRQGVISRARIAEVLGAALEPELPAESAPDEPAQDEPAHDEFAQDEPAQDAPEQHDAPQDEAAPNSPEPDDAPEHEPDGDDATPQADDVSAQGASEPENTAPPATPADDDTTGPRA